MNSTTDSPTPIPPNTPPHDDTPTSPTNIKRIVKIVAIVFLYKLNEGFVAGLHAAFAALNGHDFLNLGPFWQTVAQYTANGGADGFFESSRLALICWAGPDVINVVGPIIGNAWRSATVMVRQMSRAVQGKDDPDVPSDNKKK